MAARRIRRPRDPRSWSTGMTIRTSRAQARNSGKAHRPVKPLPPPRRKRKGTLRHRRTDPHFENASQRTAPAPHCRTRSGPSRWSLLPALLNFCACFTFSISKGLRKRYIVERGRHLLPIGGHPAKEIHQSLLFDGVCDLLRYQEPRIRSNRIGVFGRWVRDRDPEVLRNVLHRVRRRRCTLQTSIDEVARGIPHLSVQHFVLLGVSELDISQRVRLLLDRARNSLVALSAQSHRPVYRSSPADFGFPLFADLGKVIHPAVRCTAAIGAMDDNDIAGRQLNA